MIKLFFLPEGLISIGISETNIGGQVNKGSR